jgi:hypothetical protein
MHNTDSKLRWPATTVLYRRLRYCRIGTLEEEREGFSQPDCLLVKLQTADPSCSFLSLFFSRLKHNSFLNLTPRFF